jgi:drug/metabolite transporter (DMT)-like permease
VTPALRKTRLDLPASVLLVFLCASWGVQQVAVKIANLGIPAVLQTGLRSLIAALLIWLWAILRREPLFQRDGTFALGATIAFLFGAEFVLIFQGLHYITASRGVVFLYSSPFFVALGAHWFIPGERLSPIKVVGLGAAFVGVAVAFANALHLPTRDELLGDGMLLSAAAVWAGCTVIIKASRLSTISPIKVLFYQLMGSALMFLPLSPLVGERGFTALTAPIVIAFLYQTVWVAAVTYLAWFWLVSRYPASTLSAFTFLTPLFGILAGAWMLGEIIAPSLILALILVGGGIYLVNRRPRPSARPVLPNP